MEFTYETARLELTAWRHVLARIDLALCRKGGHPDEANWIIDRPLHDALVKVADGVKDAIQVLNLREEIQSYRALNELEETAKADCRRRAALRSRRTVGTALEVAVG